MSTPEYKKPPEEVDMDAQERAIRLWGTVSLVITVAAFVGAFYGLPNLFEFPADLADRLAFAALGSFFVVIWVLVGVGMVSTGRRMSPEDIGGSAAGPPSDRLAIKSAFLQNSLEQAVLAASFYAALAAVAGGPWLSLIVAGVVLFAVGRVWFYLGYRGGAKGRAPGMTLTMTPTMVGYIVVIVLFVMELL